MGRQRLACVLQSLQAHSPLQSRHGTPREGRNTPGPSEAIELSPAAQRLRERSQSQVVKPGAHHVRFSVPGSNMRRELNTRAWVSRTRKATAQEPTPASTGENKPGACASRIPIPPGASYNPKPQGQSSADGAASGRGRMD